MFQTLVKMAGLPKVPNNPNELFEMVANNPKFKQDIQQAEQMGILKRDSQGNLNVLDQDKLKNAVQSFFANMFIGK